MFKRASIKKHSNKSHLDKSSISLFFFYERLYKHFLREIAFSARNKTFRTCLRNWSEKKNYAFRSKFSFQWRIWSRNEYSKYLYMRKWHQVDGNKITFAWTKWINSICHLLTDNAYSAVFYTSWDFFFYLFIVFNKSLKLSKVYMNARYGSLY